MNIVYSLFAALICIVPITEFWKKFLRDASNEDVMKLCEIFGAGVAVGALLVRSLITDRYYFSMETFILIPGFALVILVVGVIGAGIGGMVGNIISHIPFRTVRIKEGIEKEKAYQERMEWYKKEKEWRKEKEEKERQNKNH